jgi:hypothetical protein
MRVDHRALQAWKIRFEIQYGIGGPSIVALAAIHPVTPLTGLFALVANAAAVPFIAIVAGVESLGREDFFTVPAIGIRQ